MKFKLTMASPNSVGLPIFYYIDFLLQDTSLLHFQEPKDASQLRHCEEKGEGIVV